MESKLCRQCDTIKNIIEFSWKRLNKRRQSYCKDCQNKKSRAHYQENRDVYITRARARNKIILKKIQQYVWQYLSTHPCIDCGESDIVVLEFDHQRDKLYNVYELVRERGSLIKIKQEIKKCVVRCANCHRRKTARDFGWKKLTLPR